MVKLFFMAVYYSLLRWFVQSDIVDCINSCSRLYSPLPESVVVNCMIRVSYFQGVSDLLLSGSSNQFVAAHLNRHIQIMQHLLQQNAFPIIIFIAESGADALKDKLCGAVQGDRKTVALHQ